MSEFADYLPDVFSLLGPITVRRMFGGHGVYHDGIMFALVSDETLYLKADAQNLADFQREGLEPFTYRRRGRLVRLSYHRAPEAILEDPEMARDWARRALEAARRAR